MATSHAFAWMLFCRAVKRDDLVCIRDGVEEKPRVLFDQLGRDAVHAASPALSGGSQK